jgi:beta-glucosidase
VTGTTAATAGGVRFRELNHNGTVEPYEDPRLSAEDRTADLLTRLSLPEKAGLLFHSMIGVGSPGDFDHPAGRMPLSPRELVSQRLINHFNVHELPEPAQTARWQNAMQQLAEHTPHGIPITFSSDPRHGFTDNSGVAFTSTSMSKWPENIGLAAIGDEQLVSDFADVVRQEYLAVGIRMALHPQIDLATEPRWGRQVQTFGESGNAAARFGVACLLGMQGQTLGPDSVGCTTKHFPGGGPQRDGEDPHFPYGREQVYPGGRFAEHLEPFRAAIAAGTSAVMPYYGMPVALSVDGEPIEEVGFAFNRQVITGMLREQLGYDGLVMTDWGLLNDTELDGKPFPARASGVEHLSPAERMLKVLDAGCDQFGGEYCTELLIDLAETGRIEQETIDRAASRALLLKFRLGLFDDPYVDPAAAERTVGRADFVAAGQRAQSESVTVLHDQGLLPLPGDARIFAEGFGDAANPADADVAIVRLRAPYEPRSTYGLEAMFHQGSLDFPADIVDRVVELAAQVPVILDVGCDRPAVLTPLLPSATTLVVTYGCSDEALLNALTGSVEPRGRLPFQLPRSMSAVAAARPDVASDSADPLFEFGFRKDLS